MTRPDAPSLPAHHPAISVIVDGLRARDRFLVVAHPRMDGDAIGSVLGLSHSLRAMGKRVQPISQGPFPAQLNFLPGVDGILDWPGADKWPHDWIPEAVVVCDIGGINRVHEFLADVEKLFPLPAEGQAREPGVHRPWVVNIDHHVSNKGFGDAAWIEPTACATGEMLLDLLRAGEFPLTAEVAWNLFAAILTDTGSFNYSNTSPKALHMAADLVAAGANPSEISRALYRTKPLSLMKLEAITVERIQTAADGRLAWSHICLEDFQTVGLTVYDAPDLVNLVTELDSARVSMLFIELPDKNAVTKVSFRGEGYHNLAEIAGKWGGGGHPRASGATLYRPLRKVMDLVVAELTPLCAADTPQMF